MKGVVEIDILYLVDRLESLLNEGWRVPFTSNLIINEDKFLDIIDHMRTSIPEEVKRAQRIERERERIIAQAHEEAERIVALAREQAAELVDEHQIAKAAEARAATIIERAQREAEELKRGADDYVAEVLTQLEGQLVNLLTTVRNGIKVVREGKGGSEGREEAEEGEPGARS